jgi:hypothetical protein
MAVHRPRPDGVPPAPHAFDPRESTLWQRVRRAFAELSAPLSQRS